MLVDGDLDRRPSNGVDSKHGLGGYHGSVHAKRGSKTETVYYAVGVVLGRVERHLGLPGRVEEHVRGLLPRALRGANGSGRRGRDPRGQLVARERLPRLVLAAGGEIGDIPLEEAGGNLSAIIREVKLAAGSKTVPVQFMWSNAVAGPEGPIARKHAST